MSEPPRDLPLSLLHSLSLEEAVWVPVTLGRSGDEVYRLDGPQGCVRYLKVSQHKLGVGLEPEASRLRWLAGRLEVPRVLAFEQDDARDYLLMTAVPGLIATERVHGKDVPQLVKLLAHALRQLHAVPVHDCPFDHRFEADIERARARLAQGLVDEADFDDERMGRSAEELFDELVARKPEAQDLVFTHGDYCLPNVIIQDGRVSGLIDLGRAGIGERHRDLALAAWSLAHNWGERWVPLFYEAYGLTEVDESKLDYYRLLEEFF